MMPRRVPGSWFGLVLILASCKSALPVLETPPPPPPRTQSGGPGSPGASMPPGHTIGSLPQMPVPRFAVSVFAAPRNAAASGAAYSPEWTNAVVNRFDVNHVSASPLPQKGTLGADLDAGTAALAASPDARAADILLAGSVLPGGNTQVRLLARDTRDGRLVARGEFEGESNAALARAVDDAFQQVNRYWFETARGQLTQVRVDVQGLRTDRDVTRVAEAIASVPGVRLTRHAETRVDANLANAGYVVTIEGPADAFLDGVSKIQWPAESHPARLEKLEGTAFRAKYE